jgi:hypothetical protein
VDGILPDALASLSQDEETLCLCVIVEPNAIPRTITKNIKKQLEHLKKYCDEEMIQVMQQSLPSPYPMVQPMSANAREKHAKYGQVFETSMLLFDVKQCDCSGITVPFHDDFQIQKLANKKDHTFCHLHLANKDILKALQYIFWQE